MSTGPDLLALARQGNARAIAILITRSFRYFALPFC